MLGTIEVFMTMVSELRCDAPVFAAVLRAKLTTQPFRHMVAVTFCRVDQIDAFFFCCIQNARCVVCGKRFSPLPAKLPCPDPYDGYLHSCFAKFAIFHCRFTSNRIVSHPI